MSLQSIVTEIGSALTSAATPVTAVANAATEALKGAEQIANPTTEQRINQLKEGAQADVTKFKDVLLARDAAAADALLSGLPIYIGISLPESEYSQLKATVADALNGIQLLGFYSAGRQGQLEKDIADLISVNGVVKN
jgi:hypothetical protein